LLLKQFKSVRNIKVAPVEEIAAVIGKAKTELLINYFKT
jgi:excinuclease UvrABC nuclease subunit